MDETQSLEALSNVLTEISVNPYDINLHAKHIKLSVESGSEEQANAARQMMTGFWPAGDEVWLPMINYRIQQGVDTLDDVVEVLGLFETAEQDYLSISLLQKHLGFLIDRYSHFKSTESENEAMNGRLTYEIVNPMLSAIVQRGAGHLTQGHLLWNAYLDWELEQLEGVEGEERTKRILDIEDAILARLVQPHAAHEQTFQIYSTFTTNNKPPNIYERLLVDASKSKAQAVKAYERRERNEAYLVQSNYSPEAYDYYLAYERRARKINLPVITSLYERAIADTAKRRFEGLENAEVALRSFWSGYTDVLRAEGAEPAQEESVFKRAVRSIPGSGTIWAKYLRFQERHADNVEGLMQGAAEVYDKALSTNLIQKDVEEMVALCLAQAGLIKRAIMTNDSVDGGVETLFKVVEDGITAVRAVSKQGDSRLRLEKFLADIYLSLTESPGLAVTVWQNAAKHYKSSYVAWTRYTDSLIAAGKIEEARKVFKDLVSKYLDWPEAIFDAWTSFEQVHGSLEELEECLDRVERAQATVNAKRVKEAEKAYRAQQVTSHSAEELITSAVAQTGSGMQVDQLPSSATTSLAMEVDQKSSPENGKKRKADSEPTETPGEPSKKTKKDNAAPLKRDRENSTVFVSDLPSDVSEDDLKALFKDCGAVREIKITELKNSHVATVEFNDRESVPIGLTRDKKRIRGQEISVHLAWQSTLYVTNFPEKADDASIRQLFEQFGVIFDVRWPSKRLKATRRFCYVQYTSPDAAQAALALHGKELEQGQAMNVFISNPERKKERTDAAANDKEVYVAGLSKFATKADLEKLFKTYGTVKDVRVQTDDAGLCKGVAFVEFEDEDTAQRALQANNHILRNRRIAVTLADSRVRARHKNDQSGLGRKAELLSRSVRIKGLASSTQEGLLQQALEKIVPVNRVEFFQDIGEATVELQTTADAGRLLLLPEPLDFNGSTLTVTEELPENAKKRSTVTGKKTESVESFIPRTAASRSRAGIGISKRGFQSQLAGQEDKPGEQSVSTNTAKSNGGKSQDDFRKLLNKS